MNAKEEVLLLIAGHTVKAAYIERYDKNYSLRVGHGIADLQQFVNSLDFYVVSDGYVWFMDGTWASYEDYDGSGMWVHHICPPIPPECERVSPLEEAMELDNESGQHGY
jgi:hypothetical protein